MGEFAPPADTITVENLVVDLDVAHDHDALTVDGDLELDPLLDVDLDTTVD